jgi:hypothetical protein
MGKHSLFGSNCNLQRKYYVIILFVCLRLISVSQSDGHSLIDFFFYKCELCELKMKTFKTQKKLQRKKCFEYGPS